MQAGIYAKSNLKNYENIDAWKSSNRHAIIVCLSNDFEKRKEMIVMRGVKGMNPDDVSENLGYQIGTIMWAESINWFTRTSHKTIPQDLKYHQFFYIYLNVVVAILNYDNI